MTTPTPPGPEQQPAPPPPSLTSLAFWKSGRGVLSLLVILGGIVFLIGGISDRAAGPTADNVDVKVTSCTAGGSGSLRTAEVGFTVKNTGDSVRSVKLDIEYRDGAGNRIDTDTSLVSNIKPGDTVKSAESTILDAAPDTSISCVIVGVS